DQEVQLLAGAVHVVQVALVVLVRGAQVGDVAPAGDGGAPVAPGHRDGDRAVVADLGPGNDDVHALGGPDGGHVGARPGPGPVTQPDTGGVDDRLGTDVHLLVADPNHCSGDTSA